MNGFVSFAKPIEELLSRLMARPDLHAKWLNTLSYMENCGARKIAACEHPTLVKEEVLKHAAEEFRHAHYLKRQIARLSKEPFNDYSKPFIFGGTATARYLDALDLQSSRYLKQKQLSAAAIREAAYLLVTYTIELRAEELYSIYNRLLKKSRSKVFVSSILLEEKGHLQEMIDGLSLLPDGFAAAEKICAFESSLCQKWLKAVSEEVGQEL